jgi:formylglycine-generating enzyme required for sulfatase activity
MGDGLTSLEWVTVGNPGNAPDTHHLWESGAVNYTYRIGKFEVTAGQYTEFLNAVAKTDTYGLYDSRMGERWGCNIQRSGSPGDYTYSVDADWANRPANYVNWVNAARFANWLTNGQPSGPQDGNTTEDGSYSIPNLDTDRWSLIEVCRKDTARYVIPTEDEWYKAAYHMNDGPTGNYWDYPTATNSPPSNNVLNPTLANSANFFDPYSPTFGLDLLTEVGTFTNSSSSYGTFDQGGNLHEWTELAYESQWSRFTRGGSYMSEVKYLTAWYFRYEHPTYTDDEIGFRLVEVPEPTTLAVLALGGVQLLRRQMRACNSWHSQGHHLHFLQQHLPSRVPHVSDASFRIQTSGF